MSSKHDNEVISTLKNAKKSQMLIAISKFLQKINIHSNRTRKAFELGY